MKQPSDNEIESRVSSNDEEFIELTASEALDILRKGRPLVKAKIKRLNLSGQFEHKVEIVRCHLIRPWIQDAEFKETFDIRHTEVDRGTFKTSLFKKGIKLSGTELNYLSFNECHFDEIARLRAIKVENNLHFIKCHFSGKLDLWEADLCGWLDIRDSHFVDTADLRSLHSTAGISLLNNHFQSDLLLRGAAVEKKLAFTGSRFDALVDLSKAKLRDFVYFDEIEQSDNQQFAFKNTLAERIDIEPEKIAGRLLSETDKDYRTAMYEYGLLKTCYQILHRYEAEDWAFYRFKLNQRKSVPLSWRNPVNVVARGFDFLFLDWSCRYGTDPIRAVGAAMIAIALFASAYAIGFNGFIDPPTLIGSEPNTVINRVAHGAVLSITTFTAGLTNSFAGVAKGPILTLLLIESMLGTLMWGLFVVAFGRKVIR